MQAPVKLVIKFVSLGECMQADMRILFNTKEIHQKILEITSELNLCYSMEESQNESSDYQKPVALCVLKGGLFFFADIMREVDVDFEIDFIKLSSYGDSMQSSGRVVLATDTKINLDGRDVLIIEDIVDSGHSMAFLREEFEKRGAKSVRIAALVDKHERREVDVKVDFPGFTLSQGFIVGYGMDYAEKYRALPAIYEILT